MSKPRKKHITKKCDNPECDNILDMTENHFSSRKHHYCSVECKNKGFSLFHSGENSGNFNKLIKKEDRIVQCNWCGKSFEVTLTKLKKQKNFFCCRECQALWQSNVYSKIPEVKKRKRILGNYATQKSSKTNSHCQQILDNLLTDKNINYEREKIFKYYSIDTYLPEYNLCIEVMGDYWHTNPIKNKTIKNEKQYEIIFQDKSRRTYLKRYYDIPILYLWEKDLENNPKLCVILVCEYIKNKGILNNYNSFNYYLIDDKLILNSNIIKTYFELPKKQIDKLVDYKYTRKINRKNPENYITFNCDYCGKETEQKKSEYNKNKTHCCSYECRNKLILKRITVRCAICHKEFDITISKYNNNKEKTFYCCRKCYKTRSDIMTVTCSYCNSIIVRKKYQGENDRTGLYFCNRECRRKYREANKVKLICSYCGKTIYKTPSSIKGNKTGKYFCNKDCKEKYDSIRLRKMNIENNPSKYRKISNKSA